MERNIVTIRFLITISDLQLKQITISENREWNILEWRNAEFSKKEHLFTKHSPEIEAAAKMIPKIFALKI